MQAVILAAGRGSRIGGSGGRRPKALLEIGGRTLLEHQLAALAAHGVDSPIIVVGYEQQQIRSLVNGSARYVLNERFAETNSLYSFMLAGDVVDDELLVLNCDVLFHPAILDQLVRIDGSGLVYDSQSGDDAEQMKVHLSRGLLVEMSKELPASRTDGENVGMLKFSREAARDAFRIARHLVAEGGERNWLAAGVNLAARRHAVRCVDVTGLPWTEIDFTADLEYARREVWPAIAKSVARETVPPWSPGALWRRVSHAVRPTKTAIPAA